MKTTPRPPKALIILSITAFIGQFTISMINLALVYYLRIQFSLSPQMIGLSVALYTTSYFFSCFLVDPIASKISPSHSVQISQIGMLLSILFILLTSDIQLVFLALILYGFFMAFLWPQLAAWITRGKEGPDLSRSTGAFNVSWSLGAALSPLLTGVLVETSSRVPLYLSFFLFLLVVILLTISSALVKEMKKVISEHTRRKTYQSIDRSTPLRYVSWIGNLTLYIALAVILTIFPLYALDSLPFSKSGVGFLLFVRGMSTVIVFHLLGISKWWHFNKKAIALTLISFSLISLIATQISSFLMYSLFFIAFGALFATMYTFSIFHGVSGSIHRSKRMLIHEALLTIGTIIGSTLGGALYQRFGFSQVLYMCALMVLFPLILLFVQHMKK
ncbi:MAG: MFS transporter [Spirochaetia bacterium]|nr:MFS transporter [Spirochaetia bacterium]